LFAVGRTRYGIAAIAARRQAGHRILHHGLECKRVV
jgi:hypothetical protein